MATTLPFNKREKPAADTPRETVTNDTPDTPPRRPTTGDTAGGTRRTAKGRPTRKLQASLEELFSAPALVYAARGDAWAQNHIATSAPAVAKAWADLADESPAVKRILSRITEGTAWGAVIVATGAYAVPLVAHHGLLPPPLNAVFTGEPEESSSPIVPPPPSPDAPPAPPRRDNGNGNGGMTPPTSPGQPPGVVTVAGTNSAHK